MAGQLPLSHDQNRRRRRSPFGRHPTRPMSSNLTYVCIPFRRSERQCLRLPLAALDPSILPFGPTDVVKATPAPHPLPTLPPFLLRPDASKAKRGRPRLVRGAMSDSLIQRSIMPGSSGEIKCVGEALQLASEMTRRDADGCG